MRRYPAYKPSGVEWLGEVPVGWEVVPAKAVSTCNDETLPEDTNPELQIEYLEISGVDANAGIVSTTTTTFGAAPSRARRIVRHGDVLISTVRTYLRAIAQAVEPPASLVASTGFAVLRPCAIDSGFLGYVCRAEYFISEVIARSVGVSYPAINAGQVMALKMPLPPLSEQREIAVFLDREVAKIDVLVAEQRRLIALLAEKRQAVISHAVTRGLNLDALLKPSGVDWLGDIPEGWEVVRFSRLVSIAEGQVDPEVEPYSSMVLIAPNHVESGTGRLLAMETAADQGAESGKYLFEAGAVIYSKIRPALAKVVHAPVAGLCSADMYPLTSRGKLVQEYLTWVMLTSGFTAWAVMESDRVAMPKINREKLNELMLPVPPLVEQRAISARIAHEAGKIDVLTETATAAITLLQERRAALISAAVTGKIDVRDFASGDQSPATVAA